MKTWIFEEYLGLPSMLYRLQKANGRQPGIFREKIQFGTDRYQYVLVMGPSEKACARQNSIFFIHGGGWAFGSPASFAFVGNFFARLGFHTILGGYRHAPGYKYPAQLEDICIGLKAGMRALEKLGREAGEVIAAGESAGAQLAGLLVLNEENLMRQELMAQLFSGLILISGPMDFSSCNAKQIRLGLRVFLDREDYREADPMKQLKAGFRLPLLCIHGDRDPIVDIRSSWSFYEKAKAGCPEKARFVTARGKHHLDLLGLFLEESDATRQLEGFVRNIEKM